MFVCLCTYLYKSVDYIRSRSTPEVSEMCGALYKCIIIVYIIAVQALVAEFIIILRYLLGLYVLDCSTCRSGGKFISYVINLSYKIFRHLHYFFVLLTVCMAMSGIILYLHTSEENAGIRRGGASAAAPESQSNCLFSDMCI